jgi:(1->4)-alpha-D-glucan 1-alpha-D-glucosylmutase
LQPQFGFRQTAQIVDYLAALGISHIYASPIFKAKKGSTHGYDVVDPTRFNDELGSEEELQQLLARLPERRMGRIQDIVPNHMAFASENIMLMDTMSKGPASSYFDFFDMDWEHHYDNLKGKLLAPFLGRMYAECLESGEIQLHYDADGLSVNYYEHRFPLRIESYFTVFAHQLNVLEQTLGKNQPDLLKFFGILYVLKPPAEKGEVISSEQIALGKKMLWELYNANEKIRDFIVGNLKLFNGKKGVPETFNLLDDLHSQQFFRLAFWKSATEEINYRRFFNINGLISLNIQNPVVFDYTHALLLQMVQQKKFSGLRIDHIDGLYDPAQYLNRLRTAAPDAYIVVEKILELHETLAAWPVEGTSGYDFLNFVNGVLCQTENEAEMTRVYSRFASFPLPFAEMVWDRKRLMIGKHMASDIDNLAHLMKKVFDRHRYGRDITLYGLKCALVEVMALFPVYRTYITQSSMSLQDKNYIKETVSKAKEIYPDLWYSLNLVEKFLLLDFGSDLSAEEKQIWLHFVMRFQQFTGPLMAKAMEDTLFYVYNRHWALNEVGGNPSQFGITLQQFHAFNLQRSQSCPHAMNTTSTHDTKRSEDARARLTVLSEIPQEWGKQLDRWQEINKDKKKTVKGNPMPDSNDEYFLYQTLLSIFPWAESEYGNFVSRVKEYIGKAMREAQVHTTWLKPDPDYENAYMAFIESILAVTESNTFLPGFRAFHKKIAYYGMLNSLSQITLKMTCPGMPDFYQGSELWDFSLVDPDNRRSIDFAKRVALLQQIRAGENDLPGLLRELWLQPEDGGIKMFLTYRLLQARQTNAELFQQGSYIPLETGGEWQDRVITFARKLENQWAIVIVPRFYTSLVKPGELPVGAVWQDTYVVLPAKPDGIWQDAISGLTLHCSEKALLSQMLVNHCTALFL